MSQRIAGMLQLKVDGTVYPGKGDFTYNLGFPKREAIVGTDITQGYKETPQTPFIEGAITDLPGFDLTALVKIKNASVTIELGNGKLIHLEQAWFAGEGTPSSAEGEIPVRFEGVSAEEIR